MFSNHRSFKLNYFMPCADQHHNISGSLQTNANLSENYLHCEKMVSPRCAQKQYENTRELSRTHDPSTVIVCLHCATRC